MPCITVADRESAARALRAALQDTAAAGADIWLAHAATGAELHLLSDYVNALRGDGLALHDLREVVATGAMRADPGAGEAARVPVLLVLSGQK